MEFQPDKLTEREVEIASLLLRGFSTGQIAERIGIRKRLVDAHISNMREKLNADDTILLLKVLKEHSDNDSLSDNNF